MSTAIHVVCPHCHAVNRFPSERLADHPKCGGCKNPLFTASPVELSQQHFSSHISKSDIPVLVDFWAPWCGPCKAMAPEFKKAAAQLEPDFHLAKVNSEQEQGLGVQYGIRSIPTLVLFRGGKEVARQSGAMSANDIVAWSRSH